MEYLNREQTRTQITQLAAADRPFLFLIDFNGKKGIVAELSHLKELGISCSVHGEELGKIPLTSPHPIQIEPHPIPFSQYKQGFDVVMKGIRHGDTYLLNLTYPTPLSGSIDLSNIYHRAGAPYKFMLENHFLFYSPEPFLQMKEGKIYSYPMKGTIRADEPHAREKLLRNKKELYEHYTIVDLIRNDLAIIASNIQVESFRYLESIHTHRGEILQTSTRISGTLSPDWPNRLGDLLLALLPAGSISGAPKARSVEIIREAENSERGFYTGVMGIYRNKQLDSCVNIRYLERTPNGTYAYRSGGGITAFSNAEEEYQELLTKIYVPIV